MLFTLGILAIVLGVVLCLTVIGLIVGVPLILLGVLALVGAVLSWAGGIPFASAPRGRRRRPLVQQPRPRAAPLKPRPRRLYVGAGGRLIRV